MQKRRRAGAAAAPPVPVGRGWVWALVQIALLGAEAFALLFLLAQPAFRPHDVQIRGVSHLRPAEVAHALDLPADRNIFLLSEPALEQRLTRLPWVRSATVKLSLPDRVTVTVLEWAPAAVLQVGEATYLVNDQGAILDPALEAGRLTVIDRPDFGTVRAGAQAVSPELLRMIRQMQAGFGAAFKLSLTSFELDRRDVMTAHTDRGWAIIFGQMATSDERATLEAKLAALRALGSRLDLASAPIAYVNLMNPGAPAVQMKDRVR
jgi:cell division protein FtsQ